jgi:uncharacterized protein (DUF2141 family)
MNPIFKILAAASMLALPAAAHAGDVEVDLTGVRAGGTLYVQLQTRDQFMTASRAYGEMVRAPAAGGVSLTLKDVAPGDYAVTVWHDDNANNRFDVDPATGRPADGWATVNAEALRGPPLFDQVKSTVGAEPVTIALPLHYGR